MTYLQFGSSMSRRHTSLLCEWGQSPEEGRCEEAHIYTYISICTSYFSPTVSYTPVPPAVRQEAKKSQTRNCFKCGGQCHIPSQCPSRQGNMAFHVDAASDEEHIDEEIKMKAKEAKTRLMEVIVEPNTMVGMLLIQIVLEDNKVANGES